jgi:hypothetical protein
MERRAAGGFDWDQGNRDKCQKHGVKIAQIEALFQRPVVVHPDPAHSGHERRFKAIGTGADGRHILIVFTLRRRGGSTFIRPISARFMHRKEVRHYERQKGEKTEETSAVQVRR